MYRILLCAAFACAPPQAPTPDRVSPYDVVLQDVRLRFSRELAPRLVLDRRAFTYYSAPRDTAVVEHVPSLLATLKGGAVVDDLCGTAASPDSCGGVARSDLLIRLGPVLPLPPATTIAIEQLPADPEAGRRIGDVVPVEFAVDIVVHSPCPEPPSSERCRVPDIVSYRYFLREEAPGMFLVVTRIMTGAT